MKEVKESLTQQMNKQKQEYEMHITSLRNTNKALQVELDQEKNSMSAQEEMLHSLVHNLALEVHNLTA